MSQTKQKQTYIYREEWRERRREGQIRGRGLRGTNHYV